MVIAPIIFAAALSSTFCLADNDEAKSVEAMAAVLWKAFEDQGAMDASRQMPLDGNINLPGKGIAQGSVLTEIKLHFTKGAAPGKAVRPFEGSVKRQVKIVLKAAEFSGKMGRRLVHLPNGRDDDVEIVISCGKAVMPATYEGTGSNRKVVPGVTNWQNEVIVSDVYGDNWATELGYGGDKNADMLNRFNIDLSWLFVRTAISILSTTKLEHQCGTSIEPVVKIHMHKD